jgi:hypothetical protein
LCPHDQYEIDDSSISKSKAISKPIGGIIFEDNKKIPKTTKKKKIPQKTTVSGTSLQKHRGSEPPHPILKNPSGPRYSFNSEIPEKYDDFYICVLPRDPQWLYVYWEFPDGSKGSSDKILRKDFDSAQWILRVKEAPSEPQNNVATHFDVPISVNANNWYVKIPQKGCDCVIECGKLSSDGSFTSLASTSHFTPPSDPTVKNQPFDESKTTQSQLLIDFTCDTNAVQNIARFHDRSKTVPANRSNKEPSDSLLINKTTQSKYGSDGQESRYFGSASID